MDEAVPPLPHRAPGGAAGGSDPRIDALVTAVAETRRTMARLQATESQLLAAAYEIAVDQIEDMSSAGDAGRDLPLRSMAAQIAAATRTADRTVGAQMADAALANRLMPATLAALAAGEISQSHVRAIVAEGHRITDADARAAFEEAALAVARRETPGRTRPAVRALAQSFHLRPFTERHREARSHRDVWVRDVDDGMSELTALLPSLLAHGIRDRVGEMAKAVRDARPAAGADEEHTDTRTIGEIRADVFADLALTGHPDAATSAGSVPEGEAIRAHVQVVVPAAALIGGETHGELFGRVPIDAATARLLCGAASGWDRLFTHPLSGAVLAVDRYRPSDQQRRMLRARDEHCRFPGCRMPTRRCDIDHTVAAADDGETAVTNLAHLCRRHHTLKHHSAWRVRQLPDGTLEWTAPTGRVHPDRPARTLVFTAAEDPPPF
ncbi:DUF222 domain-containing protein [Microbacterium sp. 179-B 1A2 NHS]|uniref:HNH endonuclease signature motif containing protein n=1 Tax=Microbacterium sp. 179-B 1A2 NHS TaxID=3142383 RepID=UPI0039A00536